MTQLNHTIGSLLSSNGAKKQIRLLQENSRGSDDGLAEINDPVESLLNKVANDFPVRRITWFGHVGN